MTMVHRQWKLVTHGVVVLALTVLYVALWFLYMEPSTGPLDGLNLLPAFLPLAVLGLPWSLILFLGNGGGGVVLHLLILGPAWVNLGIHAFLVWPEEENSAN